MTDALSVAMQPARSRTWGLFAGLEGGTLGWDSRVVSMCQIWLVHTTKITYQVQTEAADPREPTSPAAAFYA